MRRMTMEIPDSGSGSGGAGGGTTLEAVEFSKLILVGRTDRGEERTTVEWTLTYRIHKPNTEPNPASSTGIYSLQVQNWEVWKADTHE